MGTEGGPRRGTNEVPRALDIQRAMLIDTQSQLIVMVCNGGDVSIGRYLCIGE